MLIMGSVGALAHFLIISAFEYAPAPALAPVSYMEMVSAVAVGWLVFGDFPDAFTWTGIALIVISGLLVVSKGATKSAFVGAGPARERERSSRQDSRD